MQNELKPCPCGNAVEVKYIAGIGSSRLQYIEFFGKFFTDGGKPF